MRITAAVLVIGLLAPFLDVRGEENARAEEEAKQAQDEKATEAQLGERLQVNFAGKLTLLPAQEEHPDVVGVFRSSGHDFLLKLENPDLLDALKTYNGKEIKLVGRPRNQGKYFLAWGIDLPSPPPVHTRTRGAL